MEGGGDAASSRAALRQGMDAFLTPLKKAARSKSWRWKLVPCGSRRQAFDAFIIALRNAEMTVTALLVDAEGPVGASPCKHLQDRDGWDLTGIEDDRVHLMIQTMEAWIVADIAALKTYYGQGFAAGKLPRAVNLEEVAKSAIATALAGATQATQKGRYHKIKHASDLLKQIDREKVTLRCPSCLRLFKILDSLISTA